VRCAMATSVVSVPLFLSLISSFYLFPLFFLLFFVFLFLSFFLSLSSLLLFFSLLIVSSYFFIFFFFLLTFLLVLNCSILKFFFLSFSRVEEKELTEEERFAQGLFFVLSSRCVCCIFIKMMRKTLRLELPTE
jgi:hypothetical protein